MVKIGYSYVRFSTRDQAMGNSLKRQADATERYARVHKITLDDTLNLCDLGFSAFSSAHKNRGALGVFLAAVRSGRVKKGEILIVEALDRLSREHTLDAFDTINEIIRAGVEIHTTENEEVFTWETLDEGASASLSAKLDQARQFSKRLARRMSSAWSEKKTNGTTITSRCPGWLRLQNAQYTIIRERGEVV